MGCVFKKQLPRTKSLLDACLSSLCVRYAVLLAYLDLHVRQVLNDTFPSHAIHQLHLDFPFTFGQQLVPYPVLVSKIACAPLIWVVLAQHALQPVAPVVPACTQLRLRKRVSKSASVLLVWVVLAQHALQLVAPMIPACTQRRLRKLVSNIASASLVWVVLAQNALQPAAPMIPACRQTILVSKSAIALLGWLCLHTTMLQPVAPMIPACRQTIFGIRVSKAASVHRIHCSRMQP